MRTTLASAIDNGTPDEVLEIVKRLELLPEFGCQHAASIVARHGVEAVRLEDLARRQRALMREAAQRLLAACHDHWSNEEIEQATGYEL